MSAVPVAVADGREPLPICRRHREWLIGYYKSPEMIVRRFFSEAAPVRRQDRVSAGVPAVPAWVATIVPPAGYRRQARQARYCCAGMFCAVEEYESHQPPRFSFTMFRVEDPCRQIDGKNAFAVCCPWCGAKLPDAPFIEGS